MDDLIIHKIFSGRPRDIEDVKNFMVKKKVDKKYILEKLKEFTEIDGYSDLIDKFKAIIRENKGE